jgi:glycosyltransferase involved in cell wall biosynthesis
LIAPVGSPILSHRRPPPALRVIPIYLFWATALVLTFFVPPASPPASAIRAAGSLGFDAELTVLLVVYNKEHYLNRSLTSVLQIPLPRNRLRILCVDDASTDGSVALIREFQRRDRRLALHRHPRNLGTHAARITAVMLTSTPFLVFLDPDDELVGRGVLAALVIIRREDRDMVEFHCRLTHVRLNLTNRKCWRPPQVKLATPSELRDLFSMGLINCHLHRKIIRTEVYRLAIRSMPYGLRTARLLRFEDRLHFAFLVHSMKKNYRHIKVLGELRYYGLDDNSMSEMYQSRNESASNLEFVQDLIEKTFLYRPRV